MIVSAMYYGSASIIAAYLGRELVYTRNDGFLKPWEMVIEMAVTGDMKSNPSAPMYADGEIPIFSDCYLLARQSARASVDRHAEFDADADLYVYLVAPCRAEEVLTTECEPDANAAKAAPGESEIRAEITTETQANTGMARPMESEVQADLATDGLLNRANSRPASCAGEAQIEVEANIVALPLVTFRDGVLYIPAAYSATLNDGILEVI